MASRSKTQSNVKVVEDGIEGFTRGNITIRNEEQLRCIIAGALSTIQEAVSNMEVKVNFDLDIVDQIIKGEINDLDDMTGQLSIDRMRNLSLLILDRLDFLENLSKRREDYDK